MTFAEFLNESWKNHADHAEETAARLSEGLKLCTSSSDLNALIHLATHLYAEHLQRFTEGERVLREFAQSDFAKGTDSEFAIARSIMAFRLCEGVINPMHDRLGLTPGDLARSLATEASVYVSPLPEYPDAEYFLAAVAALRRDREMAALTLEQRRLESLRPVLQGLPHGFPQR